MNMSRRDFVGEELPRSSSQEAEATIQFALESGITVTVAVDGGYKTSREDALTKAREAVKRLAVTFEETDAARRRAQRGSGKDAGALFRSWAYR